MGNITTRYGNLYVDFRYLNKRCREVTSLKDNQTNRKKLGKILERIEAEILLGIFDYAKYFPKSKQLKEIQSIKNQQLVVETKTPTFETFYQIWLLEKEVEWRPSYKEKINIVMTKYLKPVFGHVVLMKINKESILAFRASLAKVEHGKKQKCLLPSRINQIMTVLRMILNEAAERYSFESPFKNIKNLKEPKAEVMPFTLVEVHKILMTVREDFKPYYTVRFFTGLRTSEIDGLKWKNVNFERREIYIKEALVNGILGPTKTDGSNRTIQMSPKVYEALLTQKQLTYKRSDFVFCNRTGEALDYRLVNRRVWHPLLRHLGLESRRAYQSRHTAATLWLSAGENPEWIARQLGHSTTEMLFRVYSRYVPNMTRRDGSAFEAMLDKLKTMEEM
ncbi:site-specific integrase [Acinetobacter populi]|uniref:Site-specific integrase n=1 Tax=Acinetobacter populi TaxID=1582270 RepID=A0A1Z9YVP1_9GAMM|nr:site-specific integrase [Acinetobacter populi]OUY06274.1 site-specific integrase [Acinetobacter populi]